MNFNPKIAPVTSGSEPNEGALRACMPYKGHLWPWRTDKSLVVELRNAEYLKEWDLTRDTFLECANRWSTGLVGGDNFIPKFEYKDHSAADIIVELNSKNVNHLLHNNCISINQILFWFRACKD